MKTFIIDLEEFCEEIFHEMEKISEGKNGHEYEIKASSQFTATEQTLKKIGNFIYCKLKKKDLKDEDYLIDTNDIKCSKCNEFKLNVRNREDPFIKDVYNNSVRIDICDECYDKLTDEI